MIYTSIPHGTNNVAHRDAVPVSRGAVAWLGAAVAALFVGAPVLAPADVQADPMLPLAPACDNWRFTGGLFQLETNDHATVQIPATGETLGPGEAMEAIVGKTEASFGNVSGGIKGRGKIDFTISYVRGPWAGKTHTFTGQVGDDGRASGRVDYPPGPRDRGWGNIGWHSSDALSCITPEVFPPPPPIPPPPRPDREGPVAPPSEIKVSWTPYIGGIRATVTITNNENKPTVGCVYKYELGTRSFTVTGSQEAHILFPGVPLGKYWPVAVTCENGLKYEGGTTY